MADCVLIYLKSSYLDRFTIFNLISDQKSRCENLNLIFNPLLGVQMNEYQG